MSRYFLYRRKVNVVLVVDGSLSIAADEFVLEQQFAKDTVEAFASRELFEKGGTASYVQFSGTTYDEGTFNSSQSFNAHVDSVVQTGVGTDIVEGTRPLQRLTVELVPLSTTYLTPESDTYNMLYGSHPICLSVVVVD